MGEFFHFWVNYPLNPLRHSKIWTTTKWTKEAVCGFQEGTKKSVLVLPNKSPNHSSSVSGKHLKIAMWRGQKWFFFVCLRKLDTSLPLISRTGKGRRWWVVISVADWQTLGLKEMAVIRRRDVASDHRQRFQKRSRMLFALIPPPSKQLGVTFTCGLCWRRTTEGIFLMLRKTNGRGERELFPAWKTSCVGLILFFLLGF